MAILTLVHRRTQPERQLEPQLEPLLLKSFERWAHQIGLSVPEALMMLRAAIRPESMGR